ncbi:MAG: class I SAM-dependent methyltransferase [Synechococcaceae cyanobacterium ELA739]
MPVPTYIWDSGHAAHTSSYLLRPVEFWLLSLSIHSSRPLRILDLGCGNGWLSGWLHERGHDVVGVDPSVSGIQQARSHHSKVRFECLEAEQDILSSLSLPPFDLVISTEVVEHCFSPRTWADTAFAALRPRGRFISSTPYHGYLKNCALAISGKMHGHFTALWEGGHIKFFSRLTLTSLLLDAGFENLVFQGAGRFPLLWKSMLMMAEKPDRI